MGFGVYGNRDRGRISVILLLVLAAVFAGVFAKQFYYDKSRFVTDIVSESGGAAQTVKTGLGAITPENFTAQEPEEFDENNLYEKINGKADLYLESGFKKLICQRFAASDNPDAWFEFYAYDMGSGLNAFAVYGVQKRPEGEVVGVTELAYKTPDALFMCAGKYYCEIAGSGVSESLMKAMAEAGAKFAAQAGQGGKIEQIQIFPKENLVAGSYKLYLTEAYGFDRFKNTFSAAYDVNGISITAFVLRASDEQEAGKLAAEYKQFVIENAMAKEAAAEGELKGGVLDMGGFYEIAVARGPFVIGIHEAEDMQAAVDVASKMYAAVGSGK